MQTIKHAEGFYTALNPVNQLMDGILISNTVRNLTVLASYLFFLGY